MDGTSGKRQLEETEAVESKKLKSTPKSIEWNSDSTKLAEDVSKSPEISVGVCQNYVASCWEKLLPWAEQLCAKDDAAQDELLYWETYLAKPDESVKEQFSRQLKEDFRNMYDQLVEAGCTNDEATAATNSDAAESLCDLILHLLDLMPPNSDGQKRFFALQIDVNQQGCIKFHDGRRFTSMRIQVPLHGSGPVLAASEDVDWRFWEAEGGLLSLEEDGEDVDFSVVDEWNQKICKSEISTPPGSLILLKGGDVKQPALQRFPYPLPDSSHRSLLVTLDLVTEDVKDQLISMHMEPDESEEELQCIPIPSSNRP